MCSFDIVVWEVEEASYLNPFIRDLVVGVPVTNTGEVPSPVDGQTSRGYGVGIVVHVWVVEVRTSDIFIERYNI